MSEYSDGLRYSENKALEESEAMKEIMEKDQTLSYSQAADKSRQENIETKPGKDNDVAHTLLVMDEIGEQHRIIDRVEVMGFHPNINNAMLYLRGNHTFLQQPVPERFEHEIFNVNAEYDKITQSTDQRERLHKWQELAHTVTTDLVEFLDSCLAHASLDELLSTRNEYLEYVEEYKQAIVSGNASAHMEKKQHDLEVLVERLNRHVKNKESA